MDLEEGLKGWMSMWLLDEGEGVVVHELSFATQQVAVATKKIEDLEKRNQLMVKIVSIERHEPLQTYKETQNIQLTKATTLSFNQNFHFIK